MRGGPQSWSGTWVRKGYPSGSELERFSLRPPRSPHPLPYCAGAGVTGGRECVCPPPHPQRKEMVFRRERGGLWSGLFHLLSLESVFYSGASRGVGAPGREGSSLVTLLSLDGLFIKCRLWGRKGPLEGTPRGPRPGSGGGSARALTLWRGSSGKAPSRFKHPPDTKAGAGSAGESALVNSNVPRTRGGRFVNNLPFSVAQPGGFAPPPPPCKSVAFQEAFEIGLGFLSSNFFSLFSVSFLTSSGPPPPDSPSPLPTFLPRPPPPLPLVK